MTTATLRPIRSGRRGVAAWTLFALEMAIAANALLGGVGLIVNGMGLPTAWLQDTPFGERDGQFIDPFGYRWGLTQRLRDVSPEEMSRAAAAMFGG